MLPGSSISKDIFCNCIVKTFPSGIAEILVADKAVFRRPGFEEAGADGPEVVELSNGLEAVELSDSQLMRWVDREDARAAGNLARAKRRAKANVHDLALANDFRYFVTLTLDPEKVDRYDPKAVTRKLNQWLDNQVRRRGLAYVLVAEKHRDGAIHFHGFFNDALAAVDSGTVSRGGGRPRRPRSARERAAWMADGGHAVYNLPSWTLGFTTAIELYGDRTKAVGYVCKYITKAEEKVGGRWYYSGGDLKRPEVSYCMADFDALSQQGGFRFCVEALGVEMVRMAL